MKNVNLTTCIIAEPGREARVEKVESCSLEALQKLVGGYIEFFYPFDDNIAILCNEEGKINGMAPNRMVKGPNGEQIDIVFGPFAIFGDGGDPLISLTEEQQQKYLEMFRYPEHFFVRNWEIVSEKYVPAL